MKKIQSAVGKNLQEHLGTSRIMLSDTAVGQAVIDSVHQWMAIYLSDDDGSDLTTSIFSNNLRGAASFSAYNARITYLLGKVTLLPSNQRRCLVRTQIIEYGAICEAILLDLLQCIGMRNRPAGARVLKDAKGAPVDWTKGGLFRTKPNSPSTLFHDIKFEWMIRKAAEINVFDAGLHTRLTHLRQRRNLIHNATPKGERYTDDLDSARTARSIAEDLRDDCIAYKRTHGLQLPR